MSESEQQSGHVPDGHAAEPPLCVLLVDAAPTVAESLSAALDAVDRPVELVVERTTDDALDRLRSTELHCVVAGHDEGGVDGLSLLNTVRDTGYEVPFVLFPAAGSERLASRAISAGVTDYVSRSGEGSYADLAERVATLAGKSRPGAAIRGPEGAVREMYEVVSDRQRSFERKIDALLEVGQEVLGTDYATLSHVRGDEYVFEAVRAPDDTIEVGDTLPLSATSCERVVTTERTLVVEDIGTDPELSQRMGYTDWGISCYLGAPVFADEEVYGTFCFYDDTPRRREFAPWQVTVVDLMGRWVSYELERQRTKERLGALDDLNQVSREVTASVVEQSSREEIERTVCETLVDSEAYALAWVAEASVGGDATVRAAASGDGFLADAGDGSFEGVTVDTLADTGGDDPEPERLGPTDRALRTGEMVVVDDAYDRPGETAWRVRPREHEFRSVAAVPIRHDETLYAVLTVYAERPSAFSGEEGAVVRHLGEMVGHAIAATDRKRAQLRDEVVELEFRIEGLLSKYGVPPTDEPVRFDRVVSLDEDFLLFGGAPESERGTVEALVERTPQFEDLTVESRDGGGMRFQLHVSEASVFTTATALGGRLTAATVDDDALRLVVELPLNVDAKEVSRRVTEAAPSATVLAKRQTTRREPSAGGGRPAALDELTEKQRNALETAYRAGFFEWPRERTGESIASALEVSPPTFHQHLRIAQGKVFDTVFDERAGDGG
ncbi:GAF domain-containing protein [Halobium salinum]|uniref:GAF domain-containing protein n=1 Tax=Halobium salinum TaxID=1364940 RepID=A0ABD5P6A8_9EURY|nr:GAF domain-containing protein [Halobium salinum]